MNVRQEKASRSLDAKARVNSRCRKEKRMKSCFSCPEYPCDKTRAYEKAHEIKKRAFCKYPEVR